MTHLRAPAFREASTGYSSFDREPEERLVSGQLVAAGRYRVTRELGHGGMAVVYEVEDLRTGEAVALKLVVRRLADREDAVARYHNEARLAAALDRHPRVVHPLAMGRLPELDDRLYLVTELVRGHSLGAVVLEQPRGLAIDRVGRIGHDVAQALVALHARGIVHRDVKPGNVMLEQHEGRERARLLDFGCAYATGDGGVAASADLTQAHERVGSPVYMAPEQALGLRPVPSFDIYAFGAMLYELLTGAPPYGGSTKLEVVERKCAPDDPPLPVGSRREGIPPRLAALVDRCLARDAKRRPRAEAVLGELGAVLRELGHGGELEAVADRATSKRWITATMLAVLLGGGVWWAVSVDSKQQEVSAPGVGVESEPVPEPVATIETTPVPDVLHPSEPDVQPMPEPIPEVVPDLPTPAAKAQPPRPPAPCPDVAAKAQDASRSRDWSRVLQLTKSSRCWNDAGARVWLRIEALSELRLFDECVQVGSKSRDPSVKRLVKQCQKHLDEESTP